MGASAEVAWKHPHCRDLVTKRAKVMVSISRQRLSQQKNLAQERLIPSRKNESVGDAVDDDRNAGGTREQDRGGPIVPAFVRAQSHLSRVGVTRSGRHC